MFPGRSAQRGLSGGVNSAINELGHMFNIQGPALLDVWLFHDKDTPEAEYSDSLELDLSTVEPSLAGPRRPQRCLTAAAR